MCKARSSTRRELRGRHCWPAHSPVQHMPHSWWDCCGRNRRCGDGSHVCCMYVAWMLHVCCMHVPCARMLPVSCTCCSIHAAHMLQHKCCTHAAAYMLHTCCSIHAAHMLQHTCMHVAYVLHVCCLHVACMLLACCMYAACMLHVCCTYAACVLPVCRLYVAHMSRLCCLCVAFMLHVCCLYVACVLPLCCMCVALAALLDWSDQDKWLGVALGRATYASVAAACTGVYLVLSRNDICPLGCCIGGGSCLKRRAQREALLPSESKERQGCSSMLAVMSLALPSMLSLIAEWYLPK